jgi:hypothetical protein
MSGKLWGIFPFGNRDLSCLKMRQMSSEYLEGTLGPKFLWEFTYHSERCKGCSAFISSLRASIQVLNTLPQMEAPEDLKRRLREQFHGEGNAPGAGSHKPL